VEIDGPDRVHYNAEIDVHLLPFPVISGVLTPACLAVVKFVAALTINRCIRKPILN
jgi:hypothetical protein